MAKSVDMANEWCADYFRRPKYDSEVAHVEGKTPCKVEQSHKDACDINEIVRRYGAGVTPDLMMSGPGHYGDFSNIGSYAEALQAVKEAETAFMGLPADIRNRFGHDPGAFIAFCEDPKNGEEMVKMGLAKRVDVDKPYEVPKDEGTNSKST